MKMRVRRPRPTEGEIFEALDTISEFLNLAKNVDNETWNHLRKKAEAGCKALKRAFPR